MIAWCLLALVILWMGYRERLHTRDAGGQAAPPHVVRVVHVAQTRKIRKTNMRKRKHVGGCSGGQDRVEEPMNPEEINDVEDSIAQAEPCLEIENEVHSEDRNDSGGEDRGCGELMEEEESTVSHPNDAIENARVVARELSEDERVFLRACQEMDKSTVNELLVNGRVDVNARADKESWFEGFTALMIVAVSRQKMYDASAIVRLLLDFGADPNAKSSVWQWTVLHLTKDYSIIKMLLQEGANPNVSDYEGNTPLHHATRSALAKTMEILLQHGAAVNVRNNQGVGPMHLFLRHINERPGLDPDIRLSHSMAQTLVAHGVTWDDYCDELIGDTNSLSSGFRVAIQWWIEERTRGCQALTEIPVELLLRGQSSVEQYVAAVHASDKIIFRRKVCVVGPSFWGKTSLVKSISSGVPSLEHPDTRTIGIDQFPLSFAEKAISDKQLLVEMCRVGNIEAVKWLIEHNRVDMTNHDWKGYTPIRYAVENGHVDIVQLILDNGMNPDINMKHGFTPLRLAITQRRLSVVVVVLRAGADVNATDTHGSSPLHLALRSGFLEGARLLLEKNAQVNATNENDDTPLHHSASCLEMVPSLLDAGANVHASNKDGDTPFHLLVRKVYQDSRDNVDRRPLHQVQHEISRDKLSAQLAAAQAMVSYGANWCEKCDAVANSRGLLVWDREIGDHVEFKSRHFQTFREAVLVWTDEQRQGAELTTFPMDVCVRGPAGIREYAAVTQQSRRRDTAPSHSATPSPRRPSQQVQDLGDSLRVDEVFPSTQLASHPHSCTGCEPPKALTDLDIYRRHEVTFWDFAGQEAYQVTHSAFFSKRTLYLVCVDLQAYILALEQAELRADKDTNLDWLMNEFIEAKILRWIRLILARQPDAEFVFVATKADVFAKSSSRVENALEDLSSRMRIVAATIASKSGAVNQSSGGPQLASSSPTQQALSQHDFEALQSNAKKLSHLKWLTVNCKDEGSITTARKAIEQTIIDSRRSFQMPELYSQVLEVILRHRHASLTKQPPDQLEATFVKIPRVYALLRNEIPTQRDALSDDACQAILRTLHDIGDVLWFEDLGIAFLRDTMILHPLVLIELVRQVVHHNHSCDVMTHAALKERAFWNDLDADRMLAMKRLLHRFNVVLPVGSEMKWNSDLMVPAFWRSRESALWLFLGDLLKNEPTLESVPKDICVQWEYHFTTALPDVVFDELVIASYSQDYERHAGPDWMLYSEDDQFACRVVVTRAPRTLQAVLRVEAIACASATEFMWGRFHHVVESLERVLSRYKGLVVCRFVVDDRGTAWELLDFVERRMRVPPSRREPKRWLPPSLDWYEENVMAMRDRAGR